MKPNDISTIFAEMANSGGFEAKNLSNGIDILRTMKCDKKCTKFLSFVGRVDLNWYQRNSARYDQEQNV